MKRVKVLPPIGAQVYILDGMYEGEWGIVKDIDEDNYYVAIWNDPDTTLIFEPNEIEYRR